MATTDRRERLADALHLFVLAGFAVAQPLYDLLARSPEFFLVRRAGVADVALPIVLFSLALPAALAGLEVVAGWAGAGLRRALHTALVGLLVAVIALPVLVRFGWAVGPAPLVAALAIGAAGAFAYRRLAVTRMFLGALAPAVLIFPGWYLARTRAVWTTVASESEPAVAEPAVAASVVMLVFDEFSLGSLLDAHGDVDAARYPSFARLAREATWFRNATTVASVTQAAVPALLTGRLTEPNPLGDPSIRAHNLFTLLAPSHRLDVTESYVPFCPAHLCGGTVTGSRGRAGLARDLAVLALRCVLPVDRWGALPEIAYASMLVQGGAAARLGALAALLQAQQMHDSEALGRRGRVFADFVERLGHDERPTLHYLHVMLPHEPSVYLPSGSVCANDRHREPGRWPLRPWTVTRAYQRHLLQVEYVDRMVGRLIDRLHASGAWDSTILVVTADHGVSFRPGDSRRALSATNECDVLRVPLFVKAPGQRTGGVSDRNVESIDVLPTLSAFLGLSVPWSIDGQAASAASTPRPDKAAVGPCWPEEEAYFDGHQRRTLPGDFGMRCGAPAHTADWFGRDAAGAPLPFVVGPHRELLGRRVAPADVDQDAHWRVSLERRGEFDDVGREPGMLPCPIQGRVVGTGSESPIVAVAVDGIIQAVTETEQVDAGEAAFSVVVPETAFRPGRNDVSVYRVMAAGDTSRLTHLRGVPDAP